MAKLGDDAQLDVANKLTLGIASTNTGKNYFEENFAWEPTVLASAIWSNDIPYANTEAEADAVVLGVTGTDPLVEKLIQYAMDEIPLSNEQGWAIYEVPGTPDPDFRLVDWLNPAQFGPGYFFSLYENNGTPIALTDSRYQVDCKNGIVRFDEGFTPADLGLLTPLRITLYRYVGPKGVVTSGGGGGGGATGATGATGVAGVSSGSPIIPHQEIVTFIAVDPTDGDTDIGSVTFAVISEESFRLFLNKLFLVQNQDYELVGTSNNTIRWLIDNHGIAIDPAVDQMVALYSEENVSFPLVPRQQELTPQDVGPTTGDVILTDTLDEPVNNPQGVRVFHNKLLQVQGPGRDYSLTGIGYVQIIWQPTGAGSGTAQPLETTDELVALYAQDADTAIGPTGPPGAPGPPDLTSTSIDIVLTNAIERYVGLNTGGTSGFTVYLPPFPDEGDKVLFKDQEANASVNNVTIDGNGNAIDGDLTTPFIINIDEQALMLIFAFGQWRIF